MSEPLASRPRSAQATTSITWTALIVGGCVCLSPVFACATPFAALAALAALRTGLRPALLIVALSWLANQVIGYGILGYPWTLNSLDWGISIGISACLGVLAARALSNVRRFPIAYPLSFVAAFAAYQLGLYITTFVLPGGAGGFTPAVIGYVFLVNAAGLVLLLLSYHLLAALTRTFIARRVTTPLSTQA